MAPRAPVTVTRGFVPDERAALARLYWLAFGDKLGRVLAPEERALAFLAAAMRPEGALVARDADGRVLGLAGFQTPDGGLIADELGPIAATYGWLGAAWRALLLAPLGRKPKPGALQMDGLCVDPEARGQGIGRALLDAIAAEARGRGLTEVHLDVIDGNARARLLYERMGFRAVSHDGSGIFARLYGFSGATHMVRPV